MREEHCYRIKKYDATVRGVGRELFESALLNLLFYSTVMLARTCADCSLVERGKPLCGCGQHVVAEVS
jgi:hypothetical protein